MITRTKEFKRLNKAYMILQESYRAGTIVKVMRESKDYENGWNNIWVSAVMDSYIGQEGVIEANDEYGLAIRFSDGARWSFPFFVLKVVNPKPIDLS